MNMIVARHAGMVEWLRRRVWPKYETHVQDGRPIALVLVGHPGPDGAECEVIDRIPVVAHAGPEDVEGKTVYGVLPFDLALDARVVCSVSMIALRPEQRGKELTPEEMDGAGAILVKTRTRRDYGAVWTVRRKDGKLSVGIWEHSDYRSWDDAVGHAIEAINCSPEHGPFSVYNTAGQLRFRVTVSTDSDGRTTTTVTDMYGMPDVIPTVAGV